MGNTFESLNYESAAFSGKDYHNGLWGWSTIFIGIAYGTFDVHSPVHWAAFFLVFLAFPPGVIWNGLQVTQRWINDRNGPISIVKNQIISLVMVDVMWFVGLFISIKYRNTDDPIWRFVFTTTLDCLFFKMFYFIFMAWRTILNVYIWPSALPVSPSWERLNYWASWLGLGCYQSFLWAVTEVWYSSSVGGESTRVSILADKMIGLFALGWLWFLGFVTFGDCSRVRRKVCLVHLGIYIGLTCIFIITSFATITTWHMSDPLTAFIVITTWDSICVKLPIFLHLFVAVMKGTISLS